MKNNILKIGLLIVSLMGCTSNPAAKTEGVDYKKVVIDSSNMDQPKPEWVAQNKLGWEDSGKLKLKGTYTVLGNQRLNACYELAKVEAKKAMITGIQEEIKGYLDSGSTGMSEDDQIIFTESVTAKYKGKIQGLKSTENYFERFVLNHNERVDCFVLMEIDKSDYFKLRTSILSKATELVPELQKAITNRQIEFFKKDEAESN
ncbi:hypothetical protein CIK05_11870 [Bdellovibrio sp. qaytius]|nr:hypothetical protein CIK05_11870 [Bdellovibrio sp. qaytius]